MAPIFGNISAEESEVVRDEVPNFDSMSTEEFFDDLILEAASQLNVSVEELEEMEMSEIDERLGTTVEKPYHPRGAREAYRDSDRLKTVSKDTLEYRKEVVEEKLGL